VAKTDALSLLEFQKRFSTEEACSQYLFDKKWPKGYSCPKCGHTEYYYISTRKLFECRNSNA
jgi:transcription initiation factor IIE alpha subunit